MTTSGPLIWKEHRYKDGFKTCPHCGAQLKWVYGDDKWYPCDKEPVLFAMHPEGKLSLIYNGKETGHCVLYNPNDKRTSGVPLWGYRQHYYTCDWLKQRRFEYRQRLTRRPQNDNY